MSIPTFRSVYFLSVQALMYLKGKFIINPWNFDIPEFPDMPFSLCFISQFFLQFVMWKGPAGRTGLSVEQWSILIH